MHHLSIPSDAAMLARQARLASDYAAINNLRDSYQRAQQRLAGK